MADEKNQKKPSEKKEVDVSADPPTEPFRHRDFDDVLGQTQMDIDISKLKKQEEEQASEKVDPIEAMLREKKSLARRLGLKKIFGKK